MEQRRNQARHRFPVRYEDQEIYRRGWKPASDGLQFRLADRAGTLTNLFFNPYLPTLDDYYEPWTYRYGDLLDAPQANDQPTARPVSLITEKNTDIQAGPNCNADLGGSSTYAAHDSNLRAIGFEERKQLFAIERLALLYLPRICNHCLNPGCLVACPSGAIYRRAEDGNVLVSQDKCRAERMCISGCPYKKVYYIWATGK
ncbi:MAG: 4Fe-4S dicluster domain-containing protein, partial [Hyphomicrobiales bacterium]